MKITNEIKLRAIEIAKENNVVKVWVNDLGEFFTAHNNAINSVNRDNARVVEVGVNDFVIPAEPVSKYKGITLPAAKKEADTREGRVVYDKNTKLKDLVALLEADDAISAKHEKDGGGEIGDDQNP